PRHDRPEDRQDLLPPEEGLPHHDSLPRLRTSPRIAEKIVSGWWLLVIALTLGSRLLAFGLRHRVNFLPAQLPVQAAARRRPARAGAARRSHPGGGATFRGQTAMRFPPHRARED